MVNSNYLNFAKNKPTNSKIHIRTLISNLHRILHRTDYLSLDSEDN